MPSIDDADTDKYVAVFYTNPKPYYCWGQIKKVFSNDEDTAIDKVEVEFLGRKTISSCPSEVNWTVKNKKKVLFVATKFILMGPVKGSTFRFPDTEAVSALQKLV